MKNKEILDRVAKRWFHARKTKSIQARKLTVDADIQTPEGMTKASAGDWLCQGIHGEQWPQKEKKLLSTYNVVDSEALKNDPLGEHTFEPRPDGEGVFAAQVEEAFVVEATWGTLKGKPGDYIVKSFADQNTPYPEDVWIVDQHIFNATYSRS